MPKVYSHWLPAVVLAMSCFYAESLWAEDPAAGQVEFQKQDQDGDGELTLEEYLAAAEEKFHARRRQNFQVFDTDQNGRLSLAEYLQIPDHAPRDQRGQVADPVREQMEQQIAELEKLLGGVDEISVSDWSGSRLKSLSEDLAALPVAVWDLDGNSSVSAAERRRILEEAWGYRLLDGTLIRFENGTLLHMTSLKGWDRDQDGFITEVELRQGSPTLGPKAGEIIQERDQDGDGRLSYSEIAPIITRDLPWRFLSFDTNMNGLLDREELAKIPDWDEKTSVPSMLPAFDQDGDGQLSLREYRLSPIANHYFNWGQQHQDKDHDGLLSWEEFYGYESPRFVSLFREFFTRLDQNQDGQLSLQELSFRVDLSKMKPEIFFRMQDQNQDGELTLEEFAAGIDTTPARWRFFLMDTNEDRRLTLNELQEFKPSQKITPRNDFRWRDLDGDGQLAFAELFRVTAPRPGDELAVKAFERKQQYHQEWLQKADKNQDQQLSFEEYLKSLDYVQVNGYVKFVDRDTNQDGLLSREEYLLPYQSGSLAVYAENAAKDFQRFDFDQDGQLNWEEFRLTGPGEITRNQVFYVLDEDQNGQLSLTELLRYYPPERQADGKYYFYTYKMDEETGLTFAEWMNQGREGTRPPANRFYGRDGDGDGELTLQEYLSYTEEKYHARRIRDFRVFDTDQNGRLSLSEYLQIPDSAPKEQRGPVADPVRERMEQQIAELEKLLGGVDDISTSRWSGSRLKSLSADLAALPTAVWDLDRNGVISAAERRRILEEAWGYRLLDGSEIRFDNGLLLHMTTLRNLDPDQKGYVSERELRTKSQTYGPKAAEVMRERDLDRDGQLSYSEIAPLISRDLIWRFMSMDINMNGLLDREELEKVADWDEKASAPYLIPAFDLDGDGQLSLREYRLSPIGNHYCHWGHQQDQDHDGQLSWAEFYPDKSPRFVSLFREMFTRLDRNRDGYLTYDEFPYRVDQFKLKPEVLFRIQDKNQDGKVSFEEFFTDARPTSGNAKSLENYELKLAVAENKMLTADTNKDGFLDVNEFVQMQQKAIKIAEKRKPALAKENLRERNQWFMPVMISLNVVLWLGVGWYFFSKPK